MDTCFKINDIMYMGILTQALPKSWEEKVDNLLRKLNDEPLSIVLF